MTRMEKCRQSFRGEESQKGQEGRVCPVRKTKSQMISFVSCVQTEPECFFSSPLAALFNPWIPIKSLERVAPFFGVFADSLKAKLGSFISVFKHLCKTLQDDLDGIQSIETTRAIRGSSAW